MKKILLFIFLCSSGFIFTQNLSHYQLTIAPADLDSMYAHPRDEEYYPAVFKVEDITYNVLARFKGSTTLTYPKKSWAIKFQNNLNYFGASRINLHADYKDDSKMRNFLVLNLFDFLGYPASRIKHVTYEVNGEAYGVYTQTEQIDADFLARNSRSVASLYKSRNHGALMAPTAHDEYYSNVWEIEEGGDPTFNELRAFFNKCLYWSNQDFQDKIGDWVDVDNFLTFFAVHFVLTDMDNFTKNTFLNKNNFSQKFELFPWDNEGSFGNSAFGEFDSTMVAYNMKDAHTPEYQVVFQRMLESENFKTIFKSKISKIINDGFPFLNSLIDNTYTKIKTSVYADPKKETTDSDFDNSISKLKWFIANRKQFLENNDLPQRNVLTDLYVSNPIPTATNSLITFRIKSPVVQDVNMFFADSVDYNVFGKDFKFSRIQLYDDGLHNDSLANDLIYGNTINTNNFVSPLVPVAITGAEQNYPPSGFFYVNYYGAKSLAINKGNTISNIANYLTISNMYEFENNYFVELQNTSTDKSIDLSYFHLRSSNEINDFMFTENVIVEPNEKIYISSNFNMGSQFFKGKRTFSNLYYKLQVGDSLRLLSPFLTNVISTEIKTVEKLTVQSPPLVINEINYKSGLDIKTDDWVEIFNPTEMAVDLSNWVFKDGDNSHKYTLPYGYILPSKAYVVIAENLTGFQLARPEVTNVVGSTKFGFSGSGEAVRLYDNYGQLVDSVSYSSSLPWPVEAAGTGATLELANPTLNNTVPENWYADLLKAGSPGMENYIYTKLNETNNNFIIIYPNPTNGLLNIHCKDSDVKIELFNLQGTSLRTLNILIPELVQLDLSTYPKGMYLLRISKNGINSNHKIIVK